MAAAAAPSDAAAAAEAATLQRAWPFALPVPRFALLFRSDTWRTAGARGAAVPLAMVAGGEQLLACPGGCGHSYSASRMVFHLRSHGCAKSVGGPERAEAAAASLAAAAQAVPPAAGAGPLLCPAPECAHASPNLKALRKHYAAKHHGGAQQHACSRCGKRFGRSDMLSRHAQRCGRDAPPQLACACGATFSAAFNLSRHIRARKAKQPQERHERLRAPGEGGDDAQPAASAQPSGAGAPELLPRALPHAPAGAEFSLLPL